MYTLSFIIVRGSKAKIDCLVTNFYIGTGSIEEKLMKTVEARKAKVSEKHLAESEKSHEPIHIVGKKNAGVLISMDDWRAIQETLYLLSIPKMRESIVRGLKTPVEKCSPELSW
jgi:PHD/YefM family antitoxin component YafN of YafNO toxin-antitoxin module